MPAWSSFNLQKVHHTPAMVDLADYQDNVPIPESDAIVEELRSITVAKDFGQVRFRVDETVHAVWEPPMTDGPSVWGHGKK
jgi:hypothetical protein